MIKTFEFYGFPWISYFFVLLNCSIYCDFFPHIFVKGSCFWLCTSAPPPAPLQPHSRPPAAHNLLTHNLSNTTCPHTTYSHKLDHTQLDHTELVLTQLAHTQLVHIQLVPTQLVTTQLAHTQLVTTQLVTTTYSHTTCPHTTCPHTTCHQTTYSHTLSRQLVTRSCSIVDFVTSDDCGHQAWRDHLASWRYTYLGQANPVEQQEKLENSNGG